jgi:hypothetical protein
MQINVSLRGVKRLSNLIDFSNFRDCFATARNDLLTRTLFWKHYTSELIQAYFFILNNDT